MAIQSSVPVEYIIMAIIIGTLAAIVYSLRVLVLLERRIMRIDYHIEKMADKIIDEEDKIENVVRKKKKK